MAPNVNHPGLNLPPPTGADGQQPTPTGTPPTHPLVAGNVAPASAAVTGANERPANGGAPQGGTATQPPTTGTTAQPGGATQAPNPARRTTATTANSNSAAQPAATITARQAQQILQFVNGAASRLSSLEAVVDAASSPTQRNSATENTAAGAASPATESDTVPDPVPGYKGGPLDVAVPAHIITAIRQNKLFQYSALTFQARTAARNRGKEMVLLEDGMFGLRESTKGSDATITEADWHSVAPVVLKVARQVCSSARAACLELHHINISQIAASHGWPVARDYDIRQRDTAAANPLHDIGVLDWMLVASVASRPTLKRPFDAVDGPTAAPDGRRHQQGNAPPSSTGTHCFRCGGHGHQLSTCTAFRTVAGKVPASIVIGDDGKPSLRDTGNKAYCFAWASSSRCRYGAACHHKHLCSICEKVEHGARACRAGSGASRRG